MDPSLRGVPQYAPQARRSGGFRLSPKIAIFALILVVVVIVGAVLMSLSGDKSGPLQQRLDARLTTLQKMVAEGDKNIKNGDLRELNGRLRIQLIGDQKSIDDVSSSKKTDKAITADEVDKASFDALSDAQLNSNFDATYRKLIAQKLDSTTALIRELHDKTSSKSLRTALGTAYANFHQLQDQFTPVIDQ